MNKTDPLTDHILFHLVKLNYFGEKYQAIIGRIMMMLPETVLKYYDMIQLIIHYASFHTVGVKIFVSF